MCERAQGVLVGVCMFIAPSATKAIQNFVFEYLMKLNGGFHHVVASATFGSIPAAPLAFRHISLLLSTGVLNSLQ
jgi:hypothetical protein